MAIQDRANQRRERKILLECPVCGTDLSGRTKTSDHFYTEHLPEDFGLTPLGEIRGETSALLFEDPDQLTDSDDAPTNRVQTDGGDR